jgi:multidrug resistance efflux pump
MSIGSRGIRFAWLLGFVLLLGTAAGAGWFFNQPASGTAPSNSEPLLHATWGLGYVDVDNGIIALHPQQPGRVKDVWVKEGDEVKEGDLLLSMENDVQRARLRAANADLDAARKELADAQAQLPKDRDDDIAIQKKKIKVAQLDYDAAKSELDAFVNSATGEPSKKQLENYQKKLDAALATVEVQKAILKKIEDTDVIGPVERLKDKVKAKQAHADEAQRAFFECDVYAPANGMILRLFATAGESLPAQPRQPAIQFCPGTPRIIRTEILQEFADQVHEGQFAVIVDDTRAAAKWKGKVQRVSPWFAARRSVLQEPFQYNDVRTLECIVSLDPGGPPVRIGQRMRVKIETPGG